MNSYILKSLLIATVLTIPTVSGADAGGLPDGAATAATQQQVASGSLAVRALHVGKLVQIGRSKAAALLYLGSLDYSTATLFDVIFVAQRMEQLGYPDIAINAWQRFRGANTTYSTYANNQIDRLRALVPRSVEVDLTKDVKQNLTGLIPDRSKKKYETDQEHAARLEPLAFGFLSLKDLANLALVSWTWHDVAQPMIDAANQWRHSDIIPRVLAETPTELDRRMFLLFNLDPAAAQLNFLVSILLSTSTSKDGSIMSRIPGGRLAVLEMVEQSTVLTRDHKYILGTLIRYPNVTVNDLQRTAGACEELGLREEEIQVWRRLVNHSEVSEADLVFLAWAFERLGAREEAIKAWMRSVNCTHVIVIYLIWAAEAYERLGLREEAIEVWTRIKDHLKALKRYHDLAAEALQRLQGESNRREEG